MVVLECAKICTREMVQQSDVQFVVGNYSNKFSKSERTEDCSFPKNGMMLFYYKPPFKIFQD